MPLGSTERFWRSLLERDADEKLEETFSENSTAARQKRAYLTYAHSSQLPSVRWRPVRSTGSPSPREGHLMCLLGTPSNRKVVVTGGFCDDNRVHILNISRNEQQRWISVRPQGLSSFVYGASLTPLDSARAVRFGGFRAGGYSGETNQVCVLRLTEERAAEWEIITTQGPAPTARAYHTATLVQGRYLVILGGMTTRASIMDAAVLDTRTWTWLNKYAKGPIGTIGRIPSGRHGHSVVLDQKRNRLVLFGGGGGTDLLRSGHDNSEVWELKMNNTDNIMDLFRLRWNKIYKDANEEDRGELPDENEGKASGLSPAECLVLGRCHVGIKVSSDMVLLAFGSGHPTTNGVVAYNLATDKFHRPTLSGPLPVPRFTAAAAVLDKDGWLLIHGGYTTQVEGTRGDTVLLDLAPAIRRIFPPLPTLEDSDRQVLTYRQIQDADAQQARRLHQFNDVGAMLIELSASPPNDRREIANRMLVNVIQAGGIGGRAALILSMVANGTAVIGSEEDEARAFNSEDGDNDEEDNDASIIV